MVPAVILGHSNDSTPTERHRVKQHAEKIMASLAVAGIIGLFSLWARVVALEVEVRNLKDTGRWFHGDAGPEQRR